MTLLSDILKELRGMFLADARLSLAVLALVAAVSGLIETGLVPRLAAGLLLLFGCIAIVALATVIAARRV